MDSHIAQQLREFARERRAGTLPSSGVVPPSRPEVPRAALVALSLLPLRRLFAGAGVSSRIKDFVYTLS